MAPSNDSTYVTYKDMNRFMWSALAACIALVGSIVAATWKLSNDIADVRQDVAVINVRLDGLTRQHAVPISIDGQEQAQFVLVMSPETVKEILRDQRVREQLASMKANTDGMQ